MNIFRELLAKLHIAREHMTSEYRLQASIEKLDAKMKLLLDNSLEIRTLKPASGRLRLKQEIELQMLRMLDAVARKSSIQYWLDYGTLLGAVRHGGFVPWDDDVDVGVIRNDLNPLLQSLKKALSERFSIFTWKESETSIPIGISRVVEKESGFYLDIYAYARVNGALNLSGKMTTFEKQYQNKFEDIYHNSCAAFRVPTESTRHEIDEWIEKHQVGDGDADGLVTDLHYFSASRMYRNIYNISDVFPVKEATFEGCGFPIPAKASLILEKIYDSYLSFPPDAGFYPHADAKYREIPINRLRGILDDLTCMAKDLITH